MSHTPQLNRKYDNNNHNNDFTEECTAAFICITNNSGEKFKSKIQLTRGKSQTMKITSEIKLIIFSFTMLWKESIREKY